ncbi:MAG TPA: site-specific DNA-methyltransferase, partial [Chryseobacterium sp.]|nr:site-specific DNA-methyltransferase [Chryseobacterium sp.]
MIDYTELTSQLKQWYQNLADGHPSKAHKHYNHIDKKGIYFPADISWPGGGGPKYEIMHPITKLPVKIPTRGWITPDKNKMLQWIDEDKVHFGKDENSVPCLKKYLYDSEEQTPYSVFYQDGRAASKRLRTLMSGNIFDFPKDEIVLVELIEMLTDSEDIILDFFAGSSTSAHAVMQLNSEDGGNRKYIMVQLPEATDEKSEASKAGYKNICEIGKERIRRASQKIKEDKVEKAKKDGLFSDFKDEQDYGFRVYRLDSSNMQDVYYKPQDYNQLQLDLFADNVKEDRTAEDLVTQVMLDWGLPLSLPIERKTISGKEVYAVAGDSLYCCFDDGIDEDFAKAIAQEKPLRIVFRDKGFKDDTAKENVKQLLKQLSGGTEMRVI